MIRLAFVGNQMAGKTFAANYLKRKYKWQLKPLQSGVIKIYRTLFYTERWKHIPWSKRLDIYDALYEIEPTIWVHFLERRLEQQLKPVVVHDARYLSEVEALRDMGFTIVRITTPNPKGIKLGKAKRDTVILHEYYKPDAIKVDYSFVYESRDSLRKAIDILVEDLNREV